MKIAFLNIYNGVVERGSETFVHEVSRQLSLSHDVHVYQSANTKGVTYFVHHIKNIPVHLGQGIVYDLLVFWFTLKCIPSILKEKYDWIIPVNGRLQSLIIRIIRAVTKSKILISGHSGIGFDDRFNIVIGKPDIFVALSPGAYRWARKIYSRVELIINGVNTEQFNPEVLPAKIALKKPIVFTNAALLPYKSVDLVIKAIEKLKNVSLLLIGDGPQREYIDSLGKRLLGKRFLHLPHISHSEIAPYYKASDLFILISEKQESCALVYLEALACNIPVVATDDENRRAQIGQAGLYCNIRNLDNITSTIKRALSVKWGNLPRLQAEKFSWPKIVKQYEKIMERA